MFLKNTLPHTDNGHCQKSPNIGEKCLAYVRYFAQEKVLHTFRAGKSGMVYVAKTQFLPKNPLDNLLVPLKLITLELSESVINFRGTGK